MSLAHAASVALLGVLARTITCRRRLSFSVLAAEPCFRVRTFYVYVEASKRCTACLVKVMRTIATEELAVRFALALRAAPQEVKHGPAGGVRALTASTAVLCAPRNSVVQSLILTHLIVGRS